MKKLIMEFREHQTDILANVKYDDKPSKGTKNITDQVEESKRNEVHRKVNGHNVEAPQKSIQHYEADESEENGKTTIIKVEKFDGSDDIVSQIPVDHYGNQIKLLVDLEHHCSKLKNVSVSTIGRIEGSKRKYELYRKVKGHNVEAQLESIQNYEADESEENEKRTIIKVEKFDTSDDILSQIPVDHNELKQSRENQTKLLVDLEHHCDKLKNVSVSTIDRIEGSKRNEAQQESIQNYEVDESEKNGERTIIKVEKFDSSDDIVSQIPVDHNEVEQSRENQTKFLVELEHRCDKLKNVSVSTIDQIEGSKRNEVYRKVKCHNVEAQQKSTQNYEADESEENEKRTIIKLEKFDSSDDIVSQIPIDYYKLEQNKTNQIKVLVDLEHRCDKLENVSVRTIDRTEESKRNEVYRTVKDHDVEASEESIQNYEADEYERHGKGIIKKVDKFECCDDILPQIAIDHHEPEQSRENQTNVYVKLEDLCDKLSPTSQVILNQPEEYEGSQGMKGCTTIVASAGYEVSSEGNSSTKPYSKQRRREGNLSKNQNVKVLNLIDVFENVSDNYEDVVLTELTLNDNSISVDIEASKILVTDSQCYVALEKLSYKCDICRYVTVIKELLVLHMKLHDYKQSDSISECKLQKYKQKQISVNTFACNVCSYKSAQKSFLNKHILTHTGEKILACNLCSYKSVRKSNLLQHRLIHTGEKRYACNLCSYKCARKSHLQTHLLTHTGEKPFACNLCSYKSAHNSNLLRHQLTHIGVKQFACNLCSYKCPRKSHLNIHKLTHTSEKRFACSLCSYKCADKSNLNSHKLTHIGEKRFACNLCSYKCADKSNLNRHELTHTGEKPFACNVCSYKSAHKSYLQKHQIMHTGEKLFACNLCSFKSAHKSSFNRHKLTHTGEKRFSCNLCSYKSAHKSYLQKHQVMHTGENLFACNLCSYKSAHKSSLNRHKLTHTGEKPFACNVCSYKCADKSYLQKHQLMHTGEKLFACNLCSYKSAHKSSLNRHKLTHTGEKRFSCNLCLYKSAHKSSLNRHKLTHW